MQPNPAFSYGAHFRFKPLQTSHLKSNRMCQHPVSALMQLSWFCNMVRTRDRSDTVLPIIGRGLQHGNWADKYSYPVILWLTLRTICQLISHFHCRCTHMESKTHQRNTPKKHKSTMQPGCEGERDWSLQRQKLTMKWWKVGVGCGVKRVYTPMCVWGGMSCHRNNTRAHHLVSGLEICPSSRCHTPRWDVVKSKWLPLYAYSNPNFNLLHLN